MAGEFSGSTLCLTANKRAHGGIYLRTRSIVIAAGIGGALVFLAGLVVHLVAQQTDPVCKWNFLSNTEILTQDKAAWFKMVKSCSMLLLSQGYCIHYNCNARLTTPKLTTYEPTAPSTIPDDVIIPPTPEPKDIRLPRFLTPTHYKITLQPSIYTTEDTYAAEYEGMVTITFRCDEATHNITMHKGQWFSLKNYTIDLKTTDGRQVPRVIKYDYDPEIQFLTFHLSGELVKSRHYAISMGFSHTLGGARIGYRRRTIGNYTASDGFIEDRYSESPAMPLDSVMFRFTMNIDIHEYRTNLTRRPIIIRLIGFPDWIFSRSYIVDKLEKTIEFAENYLNADYPHEKLDVTLSHTYWWTSFVSDQWGALYVACSSVESLFIQFDCIRSVVYHVFNQWIGQMTSPHWYDDFWMCRGIADYMTYKITDKLFPNQIRATIAIFRMLEGILGENAVREGLRLFYQRQRHGTFTHDQLWQALGEQEAKDGGHYDVRSIMTAWITQINTPVVTISRQGQPINTINVTQNRYIQTRRVVLNPELVAEQRWQIPISFVTSSHPTTDTDDFPMFMMKESEGWKSIRHPSIPHYQDEDSWILGNPKFYNNYHVNYEERNWRALSKQLNQHDHNLIYPHNRAQLLNDAWRFLGAELINASVVLDLSNYLDKEDRYVVWRSMWTNFRYMQSMLGSTHLHGAMRKFLHAKLTPPLQRIVTGSVPETPASRLLRYTLFVIGCHVNEPVCVEFATRTVKEWMSHPDSHSIEYEFRYLAACTAVRADTTGKVWKFFFEKWINSTHSYDRNNNNYLRYLGCTEDTDLMRRHLQQQCVDSRNCYFAVKQITKSGSGGSIVWDFYRQNEEDMRGRWYNSAERFNTQRDLEELEAQLKDVPRRAKEHMINKVKMNIRWMDRNFKTIEQWFMNNGYHF